MDINKILFEQLNINEVQNPFFAQDVDALENVQKESVQEENTEIKEEISSALNAEDEDSNLVLEDTSSLSLNKTQKHLSNTQILMNVLSNESQALEEDAQEIEEEIQKKNEEYEQLAQEIAEKQEEYNSLVSKAENSNDESVIASANELGEEINSLVGKLDSIKTEITNLESDLSAKETSANSFNTTINNLSKVQSTLSQEVAAIQETEAINSVTAADTVQEVSEVAVVSEISDVQNVQEIQNVENTKVELKTMEEYQEIIDNKFSKIWEKCGCDSNKTIQYVKDNLVDIIDIDGDGRITQIDNVIWGKTIRDIVNKRYNFANGTDEYRYDQAKKQMATCCVQLCRDSELLDLDDLENLVELCGSFSNVGAYGGSVLMNVKGNSSLNLIKISQTDNWEERLNKLIEKNNLKAGQAYSSDLIVKIKEYADATENNPENAKYLGISNAYNLLIEKLNQSENEDSNQSQQASYGSYAEWKSKNTEYQQRLYDLAVQEVVGRKSICDINGDGVLDMHDISAFNCDIDLNGDGVVDCKEKRFLTDIKEQLTEKVYRQMKKNGLNNLNTIEDVINTINIYDDDYVNKFTKDLKAKISKADDDYYDFFVSVHKPGEVLWTRKDLNHSVKGANDAGWVNMATGDASQAYKGYIDGTNSNDIEMNKQYKTSDFQEYIAKCVEFSKTENSYWHYINSADLSKENLQSILDKINNAPQKVQEKLAKVKSLVEQKIQACDKNT